MTTEFHTMEESLKNFLIEVQTDNYNSRNANLYKYNNLKIFMDPSKNKTPHFIIRIGISEAMFEIDKGEKLSGGLGSDERYVRRWLDRFFEKLDFNAAWKKSVKPKVVSMKEEQDDDE